MGELERRLDRLTEALVRERVNRKLAKFAPVVERLGLPPEAWPIIRRGTEESVRRDLVYGPPATAAQVEARITEEAQRAAELLGLTPEEIIAEAERIVERFPEGWSWD